MANVGAPLMFKRVARVDEVMRTEGWSLRIVDRLAEELGVDRATVYKLRRRASQWTQSQMRPGDAENWRAQQMQALTETALEARKAKDYSAAVRAIEVQAKIVGTIAPTNVNVNHTTTVSPAMAVRLSGLSVTELQQIAQKPDEPVIDAQFEPILVKDGGEPG